jgi:2'-5' RNA ligase
MNLSEDIYLVFDLPNTSWVDIIMAMRRDIEPIRAKLPVEITVVGSSGVGTFSEENDPEVLIKTVKEIAQSHPPFSVSFKDVRSFGDFVFWLAPDNVEPFISFQNKLIASGIKFRATRNPTYTPHCTIAAVAKGGPELHRERLRNFPVPIEPVTIKSVSFYSLHPETYDCKHLLQLPLGRA